MQTIFLLRTARKAENHRENVQEREEIHQLHVLTQFNQKKCSYPVQPLCWLHSAGLNYNIFAILFVKN